jgi:hypothetical protein
MGTVDVVIPTYRGIANEANGPLLAMLQATNCACRDPRTGGMLHQPWQCPNGKHSVRMIPPTYASSVVHWARNQNVAHALFGQPADGRPPADYLFFMDDDMVGEPHYLTRLLSYKKDIVCGICTVRRDPPRPNIRFWLPDEMRYADPLEWDWDAQKLMEIDAAGAAFMLVKRTVLEKMAQAYLDCTFEMAEDLRKLKGSAEASMCVMGYWKDKSEMRKERFEDARAKKNWPVADCWWFQFMDNAFDKQIGELGEDIGFCWKAKKLGYRIFADPQVLPGHLGVYSYSVRDYRDHIESARAGGQLIGESKPNVIGMAVGS